MHVFLYCQGWWKSRSSLITSTTDSRLKLTLSVYSWISSWIAESEGRSQLFLINRCLMFNYLCWCCLSTWNVAELIAIKVSLLFFTSIFENINFFVCFFSYFLPEFKFDWSVQACRFAQGNLLTLSFLSLKRLIHFESFCFVFLYKRDFKASKYFWRCNNDNNIHYFSWFSNPHQDFQNLVFK